MRDVAERYATFAARYRAMRRRHPAYQGFIDGLGIAILPLVLIHNETVALVVAVAVVSGMTWLTVINDRRGKRQS